MAKRLDTLLTIKLRLLLVLGCLVITSCASFSGGDNPGVVDKPEVRRLLNQAVAAEEGGNIEQASALFEQMMQRGAKSATSLNRYAVFLRRQFEIDAAEKIYLQALDNEPGHANTHYNLGILYELYQGELKKAKVHFNRYLASVNGEDSDERLVKAWIKDIDRRMAANSQQSTAGQ